MLILSIHIQLHIQPLSTLFPLISFASCQNLPTPTRCRRSRTRRYVPGPDQEFHTISPRPAGRSWLGLQQSRPWPRWVAASRSLCKGPGPERRPRCPCPLPEGMGLGRELKLANGRLTIWGAGRWKATNTCKSGVEHHRSRVGDAYSCRFVLYALLCRQLQLCRPCESEWQRHLLGVALCLGLGLFDC